MPAEPVTAARLKEALISAHRVACERCALLAVLCEACREAVGGCDTLRAIQGLPDQDEEARHAG